MQKYSKTIVVKIFVHIHVLKISKKPNWVFHAFEIDDKYGEFEIDDKYVKFGLVGKYIQNDIIADIIGLLNIPVRSDEMNVQ